ncbi:MAG TPA: lamin tail domain-containing protein [Kofleriaceae bacterium]|nr:lamin tail domain-containing protein [Kofleriaceae bacterium]
MRRVERVLLMCASACAAASCAEATSGGGDGRAQYVREVRGASVHREAVRGVKADGAVELGEVLASSTELRATLGAFDAGDFAVTTTAPGDGGLTIVSGRQTVGDIPIVDSHIYLAMAAGRLLASSYRVFDGAEVDVAPAIDRARAEELGREVLRAPADAPVREAALVIRELEGELALVWDVTIDEHVGRAVVRAAGTRAGVADAIDDRVFETRGTVSAWIAVGGAPGARGTAQRVAQRDVTVHAGSASDTTGGDGAYAVDAAAGSTVAAAVVGPAVRVKSSGSPGVSASAPAAAIVDLDLGAESGERVLAQTTAFHYVTATRRFLMDNGIAASALGAPVTTYVNLADTCNAYFSPGGRTLNFLRSGGGCNNSAEATIVAHEYGHFADEMFGGIMDGGLSEGWGDVLACYLVKSPKVGPDLFQDGEPLRTCDNSYRFPADGEDEEHDLGQAWAGFAWHLRAGLVSSMGAERGDAMARALVLPSLASNTPDIPSAVREVFLRDDDDDDLSNGTPHWDVLIAAARRHGLDFVVDRDVAPPSAVTDLAATAVSPTSVTVRWTAPGDDGAAGTAARYELRWSPDPIDESSFRRGARVRLGAPSVAGARESASFTVPPGGRIYVAIRAADELGNLSKLSNVVALDLPGPRTIFGEDVEHGRGAWETTGLWHITKLRSSGGQHAFWYGQEATGMYDTDGQPNRGTLVSPIIDLRGVASPRLSWREYADVEILELYDVLRVEVFDVDHPDLVLDATKSDARTPAFQTRLLDLSGMGDRRVRIRFTFDTVDGNSNRGEGWYVDDIRLFGEASPTPPTPQPGALLVNEILADPPTGYDANRDGVASTTSDEMIELVNTGGAPLDLSAATIADATGVRATLPAGTVLAPGEVLVIFGGGVPRLPDVRALALGPLGLNNDGDTLTIARPGGQVLTTCAYGADGGDDQSLTRALDGDARSPLVKHRTLAPTPASPGTRATGQPL